MFDEEMFLLGIKSRIELALFPPSKLGDDTGKYIKYLENKVRLLEKLQKLNITGFIQN